MNLTVTIAVGDVVRTISVPDDLLTRLGDPTAAQDRTEEDLLRAFAGAYREATRPDGLIATSAPAEPDLDAGELPPPSPIPLPIPSEEFDTPPVADPLAFPTTPPGPVVVSPGAPHRCDDCGHVAAMHPALGACEAPQTHTPAMTPADRAPCACRSFV